MLIGRGVGCLSFPFYGLNRGAKMNVYEKFEYLESKGWEWYDKFPYDKFTKETVNAKDNIFPDNEFVFIEPLNSSDIALFGIQKNFYFDANSEKLINYCFDLQKEIEDV